MYKYIIIGLIFSILSWNARAQTCNELTIPNIEFTTSKTIGECKVILNHVSIKNNSNVIINSNEGITITGGFDVYLGSTFEMNDCQSTAPRLDVTHFASPGSTFAYSGGYILSSGGVLVTERGICWSTSPYPTIENNKVICDGTGPGSFNGKMTGLTKSTTYYYRAYAINKDGFIGYAPDNKYFTTLESSIPVMGPTDEAMYITQNYALSGGSVVSSGGIGLSEWGVCWATTPNPTVDGPHTVEITSGVWWAELTELIPNTRYYARCYGTNTEGTGYGTEITFTTLPVVVPTLTETVVPTGVACTAARSGGTVSSDGGATITARGVCYATTPNPTIANSKTVDPGTIGSWTSSELMTIVPGVRYYVRSYATNSAGTGYGYPAEYTQSISSPGIGVMSIGNISYNSATASGSINSIGCGGLSSAGVCWSTTSTPSTSDSKVSITPSEGAFTVTMTGLSAGTTYYVRTYAVNSVGTAYGQISSFTTLPLTTAALTQTSVAGGPTFVAVQYTLTLGAPAVGTKYFSVIHTTGTNSGTVTDNITVNNGSTTGTLTITYDKQATSYNAVCDFNGTQTGYTNTSSQLSYLVDVIQLIPTLAATTAVTSITQTTATSGGNVTSDGNNSVSVRGICWSTSQNPTTANSKATAGSGTGSFTATMTGLSPSTTYYVRSYATNSLGTGYGTQVSFTTAALTVPILDPTGNVYAIYHTTAQSGGNVISDGGSPVTNRGICWSTSINPTTANSVYTTGTGTGSFTGYLTGLTAGTTYYVRSFATNNIGTGYGNQVSFTTLTAQIPSIDPTTAVTNISAALATSGGNVTSGNGSAVTARGVCWSTTSNPTIANSKTVDGSGGGSFISNITGLSPNTLYYVRSYATNGVGTNYGSQVSFTTTSNITATITSELASANPASYVVIWKVTLSSPAVNNMEIPCITTNGSNTGTTTVNVSFSAGQTISGANAITYTRQAGSNFTAYCSFGTMPAGYSAGSTASYFIPMLDAVVPTLAATTAVSSITQTSGSSGGNVTSDGGGSVTDRGICWSTSQNPTTSNSKVSSGSGTGSFSASLSGLTPATTYYVRAYATNSAGTGYGSQVSFTTSSLITAALTQTSVGGGPTSVGIQYTVTLGAAAPSTKYFSVTHTNTSNTGTTTENITVNSGATTGTLTITYNKQSSAYNAVCDFNGTQSGYTNTSSQLSYSIPAMVSLPTLSSTTSVSSITQTNGSSGGNVTSDGGATVTERGICWSTSQSPTTANSKATSGSGTGSFTASMSGLSAGTTYYVRSYAINSAGTAYGSQVSFTTLSAGITASISYQVFVTQPTSVTIGWFANLTAPAPSSNTIPCIVTNSSGSGTHAANGNVSQGQPSMIAIETVTYSRLAGSSYNATCTFGTMPAGYVAGATGVVTIPKQ